MLGFQVSISTRPALAGLFAASAAPIVHGNDRGSFRFCRICSSEIPARRTAPRHRRARRGSSPLAARRPRRHRPAAPHRPAECPRRRCRFAGIRRRPHIVDDRVAGRRTAAAPALPAIRRQRHPPGAPIITTSWRKRWMVRSNGPVSGPDEKALARSRSASRLVAWRLAIAAPMPSWMRCRASLSSPASALRAIRRMRQPAVPEVAAALMRIWLTARDGSTRNETTSPVSAPTVTSNSRSMVESSGLAWFIAGTSNTITAVTVAVLRLGLIAADEGQRRTTRTNSASNPPRRNAGSASQWRHHRPRRRPYRACSRGCLLGPHAHLGDDQRGQHRP